MTMVPICTKSDFIGWYLTGNAQRDKAKRYAIIQAFVICLSDTSVFYPFYYR